MKNSLLKRIFSPGAMAQAISRNTVSTGEYRVYTLIFFLLFFFTPSIISPYSKFSFPSGNFICLIVLSICALSYFIIPLALSWRKPNRREYGNTFVALNLPIFLVSFLFTMVVDISYFTYTKLPLNSPISPSHLLLTGSTYFLPTFLLYYYMKKSLRHEEKEIVLEEKSTTLTDPIKAVDEYNRNEISQKGILWRKLFLIAYILLFIPAFSDISSQYFTYDIISQAIFLILFFGIPYHLHKKHNQGDYFTKISVVNLPITLTVTLIGILAVFIYVGIVTTAYHINPEYLNVDFFSRIIDFAISIVSIIYATIAFKRFK